MFASRNPSFRSVRTVLTAVLTLSATMCLVGCPTSESKDAGAGGGGNSAPAAKGTSGANSVSGTYEFKSPEGTFVITFQGQGKFTMSMTEPGGQPDNKDGDYTINGDIVTCLVPGGIPMQLTIKSSNMLEGSVMGMTMTFVKK